MLEIKDVSFSYENLKVLENINFSLAKNEIVAIMGPSGCGKSTLLNLVAGILNQSKGDLINNSEKVSFIFQDDRLLPWLSVYDNIRIVNNSIDENKISQYIDLVGLNGFESYRPHQLSGGMKKRCGIARAFYYNSSLLLMDEAFQGLDYKLREEMIELIFNLWNYNKQSVLFVTHDVDDSIQLASRIIVLSKRPGMIIKEYLLPEYSKRFEDMEYIDSLKKEIISIISS